MLTIMYAASAFGTLANMSPPTRSIPAQSGAADTTAGRSKFMPRRTPGNALSNIRRTVPVPPPTSTTDSSPSNSSGHPSIIAGTATLASQAIARSMRLRSAGCSAANFQMSSP